MSYATLIVETNAQGNKGVTLVTLNRPIFLRG